MNIIKNQSFDEERAFYGSHGVTALNCSFDGPADGESAFKESSLIETKNCYFNLRYPFWHTKDLKIDNCHMTELCRAALWYCDNTEITGSKLHGIKALRECRGVTITDTNIISAEFGWFSRELHIKNSSAQSEYFMLRAKDLHFSDFKMKGKYSFQYVENALLENCELDTKDAFWHAKNVTVRNCTVKGEYLGWYCENVTFENCVISGTQPLCYCKDLRLINCEMHGADLSFEKSEVEAVVTSPVISIKNPSRGHITVPGVGEIIRTDPDSLCSVEVK